ncbi:hypothetical protein MKEN_00845000 [Mycena kentingensis (nom. inval.)]|nr:hypothetical protein MKEN_00845000 [Mycena kentingensis (nom. inval.)]
MYPSRPATPQPTSTSFLGTRDTPNARLQAFRATLSALSRSVSPAPTSASAGPEEVGIDTDNGEYSSQAAPANAIYGNITSSTIYAPVTMPVLGPGAHVTTLNFGPGDVQYHCL